MNMCFFLRKDKKFLPNREFRCPMLILQSSNAFPWLRLGSGTAHFTFWTGSTDTLSDTEPWPVWHGAPWGTRFSEVSFEMYGSLEDFGKMWYNDGKINKILEHIVCNSDKLDNSEQFHHAAFLGHDITRKFLRSSMQSFWNWEALNGNRRFFYPDF